MPLRISWLIAAALIAITIQPATAGQLHDAARNGDLAALQRLIADRAPLEERDAAGDTPLIAASLAGETEAVRRLLDNGAQVGGRNDRGMTALHAAAYRGHVETARLLIARGSNVDDQDNKFRSTPLHLAAEEGRLDVVRYLVSEGAHLDLREVNGITPMTRAGWRSEWDVFDFLREAGAHCQPKAMMGNELYERCIAIRN